MAKDNISTRLDQLKKPAQPSADASVVNLDPAGELGCALCYRPFPASELTVASKERFNFEAAVVVCPDCLGQLQTEMKERSAGPDLVLGLVWGILGALVVIIPLSLTIWFSYQWPERDIWLWLGCYLAFLPGFIIGRAVYYGTGRKHSLQQQGMALGLTFLSVLLISYVAQMSGINFEQDIIFKNGHPIALVDPFAFMTNLFFDQIIGVKMSQLALIGIFAGILVGLTVAWFASAGPSLFTRPYVATVARSKPVAKNS